jgi:hypothetical protein
VVYSVRYCVFENGFHESVASQKTQHIHSLPLESRVIELLRRALRTSNCSNNTTKRKGKERNALRGGGSCVSVTEHSFDLLIPGVDGGNRVDHCCSKNVLLQSAPNALGLLIYQNSFREWLVVMCRHLATKNVA